MGGGLSPKKKKKEKVLPESSKEEMLTCSKNGGMFSNKRSRKIFRSREHVLFTFKRRSRLDKQYPPKCCVVFFFYFTYCSKVENNTLMKIHVNTPLILRYL